MPKRRKRRSRLIIIDPPAAEGVPSHASETPPTSRPQPIPAQDEVISIAPSTANSQSSSISSAINISSSNNMQGNQENRDPRIGRRRRSRLIVLSSVSIVPSQQDHTPKAQLPSMPLLDNDKTAKSTSAVWIPPQPTKPLDSPETLIAAIQAPTPLTPTIAWRSPPEIDLAPTPSEWRKWRRLTPVPTHSYPYEYGFDIIPGDAYQNVP